MTAHATSTIRSLLLLLALWHCFILVIEPPRYIIPGPLDVLKAFRQHSAFLLEQSLVTLTEVILGMICGTIAGIATAIAIAAYPRFGTLVWPMIMILQSFPAFVLAPILVLWFGFGMTSKIVMTTLIIYFPIASNYTDGLRRTDPFVINAAELTPASHLQVLRYLRAPLALPSLISGLRIGATLAPLGAVIGEWVGASQGLGFVMLQSNARMQTDLTFAAMVLIALMTVTLKVIIETITKPLAPWAKSPEAPRILSLTLKGSGHR